MFPSRRTYGADHAAAPLKSSIRIRPSRVGPSSSSTLRMPRRQHVTMLVLLGISAFIGFSFVMMFRNRSSSYTDYLVPASQVDIPVDNEILLGTATAPKLENDTLKAELGNAAWKVLHTTMAKFPDKPTTDDSQALKSFVHLFARLYPCGDCARHFQQLLLKFPPQVASRSTAAVWACHVHNEVNKRLKKDLFDCSKIGDFYDCGCAGDDEPDDGKDKEKDSFTQLELEKEGLTRGG